MSLAAGNCILGKNDGKCQGTMMVNKYIGQGEDVEKDCHFSSDRSKMKKGSVSFDLHNPPNLYQR